MPRGRAWSGRGPPGPPRSGRGAGWPRLLQPAARGKFLPWPSAPARSPRSPGRVQAGAPRAPDRAARTHRARSLARVPRWLRGARRGRAGLCGPGSDGRTAAAEEQRRPRRLQTTRDPCSQQRQPGPSEGFIVAARRPRRFLRPRPAPPSRRRRLCVPAAPRRAAGREPAPGGPRRGAAPAKRGALRATPRCGAGGGRAARGSPASWVGSGGGLGCLLEETGRPGKRAFRR